MTAPQNTCPVCQVGRLHVQSITYSRMHRGLLISVPDMLQWSCDYCGHITYDRQTMLRIEATIRQAGATRNASRRTVSKTHRTPPPNNTH